jgi:phenylacetate-CoA ligase
MLWNGIQTFRLIRRALASSHWPIDKLRAWQWYRLRWLVRHAYQRVPMYRELYDSAGFHPRDLRSLEDLPRVPVLSKERLRSTAPSDRLDRRVRRERCRKMNTSGSTGSPLQIVLSPADQRWQRATAWRILFEHGYRLSDLTMEIRIAAGERFLVQSLGVARKDWLSLMDPPSSWLHHLERACPDVVIAGASTLVALAEAWPRDRQVHQPRLVFSDSEPLTPPMRECIRARLGRDPIDIFGLVELSDFAWQCEQRQGFHISADSHLVEIEGGVGPMVVTNLGMSGLPLLRYDTGDSAELEDAPCPCGRTLPRLRRIDGRSIESVALASGRRVFWPFFHEVLGGFAEIRRWRVVALSGQTLRVQIAADATIVSAVQRALAAAAPEAADWLVEPVAELPGRPGEKFRLVVTTP